MNSEEAKESSQPFDSSEMTALAHLYRGEMFRSKIWRRRLDTTTNWAVATTGIALSVSFSSASNSPLPLALVGLLVLVFLVIEARRYLYFDIWRARVRVFEVCFFGPILRREKVTTKGRWNEALVGDYASLRFHITYWEAMGRHLRRNYAWIFIIQAISYLAKISVHPTSVESFDELYRRAAIGPLPGEVVLGIGVFFHAGWIVCSLLTLRKQRAVGRAQRVSGPKKSDDPLRKLDIEV